MKATTYRCDWCNIPIDGASGPKAAVNRMLGLSLVELSCQPGLINNPIPEGLHYHRFCFERALRQLRDEVEV